MLLIIFSTFVCRETAQGARADKCLRDVYRGAHMEEKWGKHMEIVLEKSVILIRNEGAFMLIAY